MKERQKENKRKRKDSNIQKNKDLLELYAINGKTGEP